MSQNDYTNYFPAIQSNWLTEGFCMWRCVQLFEQYIFADKNNITMTLTQYNEQIGLVHNNVQPTGLMKLQRDLGYNNILNVCQLFTLF
jgi:hypothetical protein